MGFFEVFLGMLLIPTLFLHLPGRTTVRPDELGSHLSESFSCFCGIPPAASNATSLAVATAFNTENALPTCQDTHAPWQIWLMYTVMWFPAILSDLALLKYGSAVLVSVVSAVSVPVTVAFYQWEWLAGPAVQEGFTWNVGAAMIASAAGVAIYSSVGERQKQRQLSLVSAWSGTRSNSREFDWPKDNDTYQYDRLEDDDVGGSGYAELSQGARP